MKENYLELDFTNHEEAKRIFDEAFDHPKIHYIVRPKDKDTAISWFREHAFMRSFGWGDKPQLPMRRGELIHLDELYYRERCGYVTDTDKLEEYGEAYLCDAPDSDDAEIDEPSGKRLCDAKQCPIASLADCQDLKKLDHDLWKEHDCDTRGEEAYTYDEEWMILHTRPRYAYVENITILGCEDVYSRGW